MSETSRPPLRLATLLVVSVVGLLVCSGVSSSATAVKSNAAKTQIQEANDQLATEALVISCAGQGGPWELAREDLRAAVADDPELATHFEPAISALYQLEHLPDAGVTPQISGRYSADGEVLDRALGPGTGRAVAAGSPGTPAGPYFRMAAQSWFREPKSPSSGVDRPEIRAAISALQRGIAAHSKGSRYFPAAILDLKDVEFVPKSEIASGVQNRYWTEIAFLNYLFSLEPSGASGTSGTNPVLARS